MTNPIKKLPRYFFLLLFGLLFLVVGLWIQPDHDGWTVVEGQAMGSKKEYSDEGYSYYPIVRYTDDEGLMYRTEAKFGSGSEPRMGEIFEVAYPPGQAAKGEVVAKGFVKFIPLISICVGLVITVLAGARLLFLAFVSTGLIVHLVRSR